MHKKYVFVTGGVVSSLGKGICAASIGTLLEKYDLNVQILKLDPYINVDPGTMNPLQHGEVFVTKDGAETDMDLGYYERFTNVCTSKQNNFTTGQIYQTVIENERNGKYLGQTIQMIPHVTDEIKRRIEKVNADVVIVEIGGTVGDIESLPFTETIRQIATCEPDHTCFVHLTLLPYLKTAQEIKTKPTTHSVKELRQLGIQPNVLLCRTEIPYTPVERKKISLFTNVPERNVIQVPDVNDVHKVPLVLHEQKLDEIVLNHLGIMTTKIPDLSDWQNVVHLKIYNENMSRMSEPGYDDVTVAMVGKYMNLSDSYKSLNEALKHAGLYTQNNVNVKYVDAENCSDDDLKNVHGIVVPGGFGDRGVDGKINACKYARLNNVPFLGICLGMQLACVEFARNVLYLTNANSSEFDENTPCKVFHYWSELDAIHKMGGTLRLGEYTCSLIPDSLAAKIYGKSEICERHRHRFEFNNEYYDLFNMNGMKITGVFNASNTCQLVEIVELQDHPWFVGVQFHPEFTSNPKIGHPLFKSFVSTCARKKSM